MIYRGHGTNYIDNYTRTDNKTERDSESLANPYGPPDAMMMPIRN